MRQANLVLLVDGEPSPARGVTVARENLGVEEGSPATSMSLESRNTNFWYRLPKTSLKRTQGIT